MNDATVATRKNRMDTTTNVIASVGVTPNSRLAKKNYCSIDILQDFVDTKENAFSHQV